MAKNASRRRFLRRMSNYLQPGCRGVAFCRVWASTERKCDDVLYEQRLMALDGSRVIAVAQLSLVVPVNDVRHFPEEEPV